MAMDKPKIDSFTKLDTWKCGHILVLRVFNYCDTLPRGDVLRNQMERSALSITSNIAEGFGRQSQPDKKHFYVMARGSAYELQNQLILARDTKRFSAENFAELAVLSLDSIRLLHGLIRSLNQGLDASS